MIPGNVSADNLDVLLVEDDNDYAEEVCSYFRSHHLQTEHVRTLDDTIARIKEASPTIVIMDQFLGSADTLSVLPSIRKNFAGGLMILTGNPDAMDRVVGLELGADDFVSKLVSPREIVARVRSLIRSRKADMVAKEAAPAASASEHRAAEQWKLDTVRRELFDPAGNLIHLTSTEFGLLKYLAERRGQTISRAELSAAILHRKYDALDRSVDNLISRLRKKFDEIEPDCGALKSIRTEGYVFVGFGSELAAG